MFVPEGKLTEVLNSPLSLHLVRKEGWIATDSHSFLFMYNDFFKVSFILKDYFAKCRMIC